MTSNASIKQFADQLSDIYLRIEDAKAEAAALIDAAKEAGLEARDIKALRKIAKEMVMMPDRLLEKYEGEAQLELFREVTGIRKKKGLDGHREAA